MARDFVDLRDGDTLEPYHINICYRELRRWRKLKATWPLSLVGAESSDSPPAISYLGRKPIWIQLVTNGMSTAPFGHDWKEMIWDQNATPDPKWVESGVTTYVSSATIGDKAYEWNGLLCPKSDAIYEAHRDNWGILRFRAIRFLGKVSSDITATATGTVRIWARQSGTIVDTGLDVQALNWNSLTKVTSGHRVMITPVETQWVIDYEEC